MRISADSDDPDYWPELVGMVTIKLNDVDVTEMCVVADDVEGYVICHLKESESGAEYVLTEDRRSVATYRAEGRVTIKRRPITRGKTDD